MKSTSLPPSFRFLFEHFLVSPNDHSCLNNLYSFFLTSSNLLRRALLSFLVIELFTQQPQTVRSVGLRWEEAAINCKKKGAVSGKGIM